MKNKLMSLSLIFVLAIAFFPHPAQANINITDQTRTRRFLAAGLVEYHYIFQTPAGRVHANVIVADMTNPNLEFRPIWSTAGVQQLATTQNIVTQNNAIAGINADFFAWASNVAPGRGSPVGGVVRDSIMVSSGTHESGAAAFFQHTNGTFFTDFLGATISVRHSRNGEVTLDETIGGMNKFSNLAQPFVYTPAWGANFRSVWEGMHKVIVEDARTGIITEIHDEMGDTPIPPNGFVFVSLPDRFEPAQSWEVGDRLEVATSVTPNLNTIQSAVGAGTFLVRNGAIAPITHGPTGRHPRSGVGTCASGTTLFLVTVDGRLNHSIGASLPEFAGIMRRIGAHSAVNLDGGGSTAMVAQARNGTIGLLNRPSENRAVANVIGIMSRGLSCNELHRIEIELDRERIRLGESVNATVLGFDRYGNELPLNPAGIVLTGQTPTNIGTHNIRAIYTDAYENQFTAEEAIMVLEPFSDVAPDHWASEAIRVMFQQRIMGSIEAGSRVFAPNNTLSRAMVATILHRMAGEPAATGVADFEDVRENQWYSQAIAWASENGIVNGMGDGTFAPYASVTREQFAAMMHRFAEFENMDTHVPASFTLARFEDEEEVSDWATESMRWANHRGLITGVTATTIQPEGTATRAQCATILHRFLNL